MVYLVGVIGFIGGFVFGQMVLYFLLRNVSQEDLLNDPYIRWKYGLLNWIIAGLGVYSCISMYDRYF
jgi:ABC-type antimicrobial peptide transport system permease subunit